MAGKPREAEKRTADTQQAEQPSTASPEGVQSGQPAAAGGAGRRTATVNLPFVTAEFRAPELRAPSREELREAARGARSMLPSRKSMLFFGGLAATAVAGVIEWPVAAAIGIGSALASQGSADPRPRGDGPGPTESSTGGQEGTTA